MPRVKLSPRFQSYRFNTAPYEKKNIIEANQLKIRLFPERSAEWDSFKFIWRFIV